MKKAKVAEAIVDIQNKVSGLEGFVGEALTTTTLPAMMDGYFQLLSGTINISVKELLDTNFAEMYEFISQLIETRDDLKNKSNPSDLDRLNNVESILNGITSGEEEDFEREIETENRSREREGKSQLNSRLSKKTSSTWNRMISPEMRGQLAKGANWAWEGGLSPLLRQSLGPVYDLVATPLGATGNIISSLKKDLDRSNNKQVEVLEDIRDSLKTSEYKFEDREKKKGVYEANLENGMKSILSWIKDFAGNFTKLFKYGAPIAVALAGYLAMKEDLNNMYQRLKDAWDNSSEDEKEEAAAVVDAKVAAEPNKFGIYGDDTVSDNQTFLSNFTRTVGQTMAFVGNKFDALTGWGDPTKTSRNPWMGVWNPATWIDAGVNAAFGRSYDPANYGYHSVLEQKPGWWDLTKSNVNYIGGENVELSTALQSRSYLQYLGMPQMGTRRAEEALYLTEEERKKRKEEEEYLSNYRIGENSALNNLMKGKSAFENSVFPSVGGNSVNNVVTNNFNVPNLDGRTY